jgi:hypothetical protein
MKCAHNMVRDFTSLRYVWIYVFYDLNSSLVKHKIKLKLVSMNINFG